MKKIWTINSLQELNLFAKQTLTEIEKSVSAFDRATIITLHGDLGVGKTTLTQMIGNQLGITEPIGSPTFVISKYYDLKKQSWKRLIHIDAYRLDGHNLDPLDFPALFADPNNIVIVEWPEYIASVLPEKYISISISHNQDDSRTVEMK